MTNKIEEHDFRSVHGEMFQVWGLTRGALVVLFKIFISEITELISDSPKASNGSIIHSYTYFQFQPIFLWYIKYDGSLRV